MGEGELRRGGGGQNRVLCIPVCQHSTISPTTDCLELSTRDFKYESLCHPSEVS